MAMSVAAPALTDGPEGSVRRVIGTFTFDNSYPTGGLAFPLASIGARYLVALEVFPKGGYMLNWDGSQVAPKVMAYRQTAATGALAEVPNLTDISAAVVGAMYIAYVRS